MDEIQTAVALALRDTETCTVAAEVRQLARRGHSEDERCVLAVVTHRHPKAGVLEDVIGGQEGDLGEEQGW
jgi:CII-binding regulator of phage lambda lysogenization HflD